MNKSFLRAIVTYLSGCDRCRLIQSYPIKMAEKNVLSPTLCVDFVISRANRSIFCHGVVSAIHLFLFLAHLSTECSVS